MTDSTSPVALVTGGGTGVGRACSLQLARRGYDVIVNFSRSETEASETAADIEKLGRRALVAQCDVSSDQSVRGMLDSIRNEFGRLDVVINNAATTSFIEHQDLESLTEEIWDRTLGVNLKGAFFVTRAATPLLRETAKREDAGHGAVVNVSSVAGIIGTGSSIAYCASKAGLITMTKSLARVLAPDITVNAVCPGPIDTRWIAGNPKWDLDEIVADYPIPRPSQPDDIADAVVFLRPRPPCPLARCSPSMADRC